MRLLSLSREAFLTGLTGYEEAMAPTTDSRPTGDVNEPSERDKAELLAGVGLLSHLDSGALRQLADRSVVERWPGASAIVRQGEEGDRLYLILAGRAIVSVGSEWSANYGPVITSARSPSCTRWRARPPCKPPVPWSRWGWTVRISPPRCVPG
ncbi:MAG TPA: cyclic nucleotide-binding domain-containing protein [Acidimicrobiales bacterium]|nr:cyclic nucleotide-binding domain-containing protein [Acidimicrobiales bacterium]